MVEMEVVDVRVDQSGNNPYLLLRALDGTGRILPIVTRGFEASAIKLALDRQTTPRPMTHDLMHDLIGAARAKVVRVVVTSLTDRVFHAEVVLAVGGDEVSVSARTTDAVALAVRAGVKVYAEEAVIDEAGVEPAVLEVAGDEEPGDSTELVDRFREFIENINPEDFGTTA